MPTKREDEFLAQVYVAQKATGGFLRAGHIIENKRMKTLPRESCERMLKSWQERGLYEYAGSDIGMGMLTKEGMAKGERAYHRVKVDTSNSTKDERERALIFITGLVVSVALFVYMMHGLLRTLS